MPQPNLTVAWLSRALPCKVGVVSLNFLWLVSASNPNISPPRQVLYPKGGYAEERAVITVFGDPVLLENFTR